MRVDTFMLADGAQAVAGKMYVLGGGWDSLTVQDLPTSHPVAAAFRAQIQWDETHTKHEFTIEIQDVDRTAVQHVVTGEFEVGTPPGITRGAVQPFMLAVNFAIQVPRVADYTVVLMIDDEEMARYPFRVTQRLPSRSGSGV